jgi:hypothetical protein
MEIGWTSNTSLGTNFSRVHSLKFLGNNSYKSYATDKVNTLTFSSIYLNIICKYSCLSKSRICHITSDKTRYVPHCRLHVRHLDCMPRITENLHRFTYKTVFTVWLKLTAYVCECQNKIVSGLFHTETTLLIQGPFYKESYDWIPRMAISGTARIRFKFW